MSLVIGAAGAVGKRLIGALTYRGDNVVAAMRATPLPDHLQTQVATQVMNFDVTDVAALRKIFKRNPEITTVWNMNVVRPRSTDKETTVGGMSNLLQVMSEFRVKRMILLDSIASFGAEAPKSGVTARWLTENPGQEVDSSFGNQKKECRALMKKFCEEHEGDTRFAVVPCLLHSENVWGEGLTSYPLEALKAAMDGLPYVCPVDADKPLPMIYVDDLARGLLDLTDTPSNMLFEPEHGYAIPGFSCTARELFTEIQKHIPEFEYVIDPDKQNAAMTRKMHSWPDSFSTVETSRDLGYRSQFNLERTVNRILRAHRARRQPRASAAELCSVSQPKLYDA